MKTYTYSTEANDPKKIDLFDLGHLGMCPWQATFSIDSGVITVWDARVFYRERDDEDYQVIPVSTFVRGDWNYKEVLEAFWRKLKDKEMADFEAAQSDRYYQQWKDDNGPKDAA